MIYTGSVLVVIITYESLLFQMQSSSINVTRFSSVTECSVAANEVRKVIDKVVLAKSKRVTDLSISCEQLAKIPGTN